MDYQNREVYRKNYYLVSDKVFYFTIIRMEKNYFIFFNKKGFLKFSYMFGLPRMSNDITIEKGEYFEKQLFNKFPNKFRYKIVKHVL